MLEKTPSTGCSLRPHANSSKRSSPKMFKMNSSSLFLHVHPFSPTEKNKSTVLALDYSPFSPYPSSFFLYRWLIFFNIFIIDTIFKWCFLFIMLVDIVQNLKFFITKMSLSSMSYSKKFFVQYIFLSNSLV